MGKLTTFEACILNVNNNRFSRRVLIVTFEKRDPQDLEAQAKALKKLTQASQVHKYKYKYSHRSCSIASNLAFDTVHYHLTSNFTMAFC